MIDFKIFSHISPITFIEQFRQTNYFAYRFKQKIKMKPDVKIEPPLNIDLEKEKTYVEHLMDAYSDNYKSAVLEQSLPEVYKSHFKRQRRFFYCAEALEKITRDACRNNKPFEDLKEDIHNAIIDEVESDSHKDGYERLKKCLSESRNCRISSSNEIHDAVDSSGQQGMCHYLANENKVKWIREDNQ